MKAPSNMSESLMELRVSFPGGKAVDAELGSRLIRTDQSLAHGGAGTAPEPFELFLASLATCAGFYVLSYCQARGIPTDGLRLVQNHRFDESTHRLSHVELRLEIPPTFPEKHRSGIVQAAAACKVKKLLMAPPEVVVTAVEAEASSVPCERAARPSRTSILRSLEERKS